MNFKILIIFASGRTSRFIIEKNFKSSIDDIKAELISNKISLDDVVHITEKMGKISVINDVRNTFTSKMYPLDTFEKLKIVEEKYDFVIIDAGNRFENAMTISALNVASNSVIIFAIGVVGMIVFFSDEVSILIYSVKQRLKINRNIRAIYNSNSPSRYGIIGNHIRMIIESSETSKVFVSVDRFIFISLGIGCAIFLTVYSFLGIEASLILGIIVATFPYYIILIRLKIRRTYGSREGDVLVFEILNNYRIQSFNMREAIEYTALNIENAPVSKSVLLNLSKKLNLASSESELNSALDSFKYSFDTAWANILASNIFFSIYRGLQVEKSLEALSSSISKGRQIIEYEKRENYEAWLMIKYLTPVSYVLSIFGAIYFFDLSIKDFFYYQFETETGIKWFLISTFIYLFSLGLSKLVASEKLDI